MRLARSKRLSSLRPLKLNHLTDPLTLPLEIVSQIFSHAVHQPALPKDGEWRRDFSPLYLGRVCRDWRKFAWSTPELWSTIMIGLNEDADGENDVHLTLLQEWLDRAGRSRDLDIYFSKALAPQRDSNALLLDLAPVKMLRLLAHCSAQWSAVSLRMPHAWLAYLDEFGREVKLSCPRLRSFLLDDAGSPIFSETVVDMRDAPLLRKLTIRNSVLITHGILKIPQQQIAVINILPATTRIFDLHQCLLRFPNVVALRFTDFYSNLHVTNWRMTSHPNIRSLEVSCSDNHTPKLLEILCLPALENLKITVLGKSPYLMMEDVWPFIQQSRCQLTSLYLKFNICSLEDEQDIYEFLSNLPDLKELYIHDPFHSSNGLSRLFFNVLHPSWTEPYLPFLEVFSYEGPLCVEPQELLDPLILRARLFMDNRYDSDETAVATDLKYVQIKADQHEAKASSNRLLDSETFTDLDDLRKAGIVNLLNRDGTTWNFTDAAIEKQERDLLDTRT